MNRRARRFASEHAGPPRRLARCFSVPELRCAGGGGALSLHLPRLAFKLDAQGNPTDVFQYPIKRSNELIEE
jgi:hypothetical protein